MLMRREIRRCLYSSKIVEQLTTSSQYPQTNQTKKNFQFENLELEELELEFSGSDKTGENQNKTFKQKLTFESFSLTMKYIFLPRAKPQRVWPPA